MTIGSAIVIFVLGAILAYGVDAEIAGLDLDTIGLILMGAGVVGGIIGLLMMMSRRRGRVTEVHRTVDGDVVYTEDRI